ncbi:hypothetical protein MXMO3_01733 [Maritalea myrionectae]|uniref:Uncharacterized protein n=1 Tax=Maritalea myrionectae TaxID=454601 RepID=A0A2R4MEG7_9HYPH|nr:hypothetical protein MXMO3_01733 [Maritalea myrionectae]
MRNVFFGDAVIGRVTRAEHGPREGKWKWNGRWGGLVDGRPVANSGECDSLEEALVALRACAVRTAQNHPNIMRQAVGDVADHLI